MLTIICVDTYAQRDRVYNDAGRGLHPRPKRLNALIAFEVYPTSKP